jgi:hypothetical protein
MALALSQRRSRPALVVLTITAALASCALAQRAERAREVIGPGAPVAGRRCGPDAAPARLPEVRMLVDSAALVRDLAALAAAARDSRGTVVSLAFDSLGALVSRHVVESSLAPGETDAVATAVAQHAREQPSGPAWGVRLRVTPGPTPALRVGRRVVCPPAPVEVRRVARGALMPSLAPAVYERPPAPISGGWMGGAPYHRPVRMRALVDAAGRVVDVRLLNSSGMKATDEAIALSAYGREFLPALEDGRAAARWGLVVY